MQNRVLNFIISLLVYFVGLTIIVVIISKLLFGDYTHGMWEVRVFTAGYFAYTKRIKILSEPN
jgi:hypothetical protein